MVVVPNYSHEPSSRGPLLYVRGGDYVPFASLPATACQGHGAMIRVGGHQQQFQVITSEACFDVRVQVSEGIPDTYMPTRVCVWPTIHLYPQDNNKMSVLHAGEGWGGGVIRHFY